MLWSDSELMGLVAELHGDQRDPVGELYARHPVRVMYRLHRVADTHARVVGALHDVAEDVVGGRGVLVSLGLPDGVLDSLDLLTRPTGMRYTDYVGRLADSGDVTAMVAKVADLLDNLAPARVEALHQLTGRDMTRRYTDALRTLARALPRDCLQGVVAGDVTFDDRGRPTGGTPLSAAAVEGLTSACAA